MDLNTLCLSRHPLRVIAIAILAGCGSHVAPTGSVNSNRRGVSATHGKSWMLPEAKTIKKLLYISGGLYSVAVYNYRDWSRGWDAPGLQQACPGNALTVRVMSLLQMMPLLMPRSVEYAHGGTAPLQTLSTGAYSVGCSVDPTTGNLSRSKLNRTRYLDFQERFGNPNHL